MEVYIGVVVVVAVVLCWWWRRGIQPSQCNRRVRLRKAFHDYAVYSVLESDGSMGYSKEALANISTVFEEKFPGSGHIINGHLSTYLYGIRLGISDQIAHASTDLLDYMHGLLRCNKDHLTSAWNDFTIEMTRPGGDTLAQVSARTEAAVRVADALCGLPAGST